jgi:hypothetical protein
VKVTQSSVLLFVLSRALARRFRSHEWGQEFVTAATPGQRSFRNGVALVVLRRILNCSVLTSSVHRTRLFVADACLHRRRRRSCIFRAGTPCMRHFSVGKTPTFLASATIVEPKMQPARAPRNRSP